MSIGIFCSAITLCFLSGCDLIKMKGEPQNGDRKAVARANNTYLYQDELAGIVPHGTSKDDSAARMQSYVNSWIRKQLLIQEAMKKIDINEAEVERKILDYRYSLIAYEYQSYYVREHLDTVITDNEIEEYYKDNIDNFILKQNIVKATFIKVSKSAPRTATLKGLILSKNEKDQEELKSYCLSFSVAYHISDSTWLPFDELVRNSPLAEIPNKVQFLKTTPYYQTEDDDYLYFLKVDEYHISDNISPIEFVRSDIKNIILNKRKVELARQLEDEVYQNAIKDKSFEIYH